MDENKKIGHGEAVDMVSWTHNTVMNGLGFQLLQLVTGKIVMIPGLTMGYLVLDSLYDDEMMRNIMEHHYMMMKEFRELEFLKKLRRASKIRMKGYEDIKISEGDLVFYQYQENKEGLGPEKEFETNNGDVFHFCKWKY